MLCGTWSSRAAVCWAESAAGFWSHWRYVSPRHLRLGSHCAPRPRSHCQLETRTQTCTSGFDLLNKMNESEKSSSRCSNYWKPRTVFLIVLCFTQLFWFTASNAPWFLQASHLQKSCRDQTEWMMIYTSFSVVPVPIIQFILLANCADSGCHSSRHQHHHQRTRGHDEQTLQPVKKEEEDAGLIMCIR